VMTQYDSVFRRNLAVLVDISIDGVTWLRTHQNWGIINLLLVLQHAYSVVSVKREHRFSDPTQPTHSEPVCVYALINTAQRKYFIAISGHIKSGCPAIRSR